MVVHPNYYPSVMCADLSDLRKEVSQMDSCPIAGYHVDIMDGRFVPNFAFWACALKGLAKFDQQAY